MWNWKGATEDVASVKAGQSIWVSDSSEFRHRARVLPMSPGSTEVTAELVDPRATVILASEVGPIESPAAADYEVTLATNRAACDDMKRLARETGQSIGEVLTKGLILFGESVKAQRAGQFVGVWSDPESMESVFTGLGPGLDREDDYPQVDEASPDVTTHRVTSWLAGATPGTLVERFDADGRAWGGVVMAGGLIRVWPGNRERKDALKPSPAPASEPEPPRPAPTVVMPNRSAGVTMTRTDRFNDSTRTTTATFWREDAGTPLDDLGEMAWRALNGEPADEQEGGYGTAVGDDGPPFDGAHAASDVEGGRN